MSGLLRGVVKGLMTGLREAAPHDRRVARAAQLVEGAAGVAYILDAHRAGDDPLRRAAQVTEAIKAYEPLV